MRRGDVVTARVAIDEDLDGVTIRHADVGHVGHVVDVLPGGWSIVWWETTGATVQCHDDDEVTPRGQT